MEINVVMLFPSRGASIFDSVCSQGDPFKVKFLSVIRMQA